MEAKEIAEALKNLSDEKVKEVNEHLGGSHVHPLTVCQTGYYYDNRTGTCILDVGKQNP